MIANSILFDRAVGEMRPRIRELEDWDGLRYCSVPDDELDAFVEAFVARCHERARPVGPRLKRLRFSLSFY